MKGQDNTLDVKHTHCCKQLFEQSIKSAVLFCIIWVKTLLYSKTGWLNKNRIALSVDIRKWNKFILIQRSSFSAVDRSLSFRRGR